ncbi:hypothetical protein DB88DRAFT_165970 [Papiliotrema laurentii]|uniref:Uncharacterized protein n=1 Tax=Papiliotrema laurentii TaxID=5418 RepID=A0AAD9FUK2_PAPLA|nr:hypothetical protein DB88DRAFT_165970 [Papiliotrema laurentii]
MQEMGRGRRQREQWEVVGYASGDETGGGGDAPRLLRFYTRQKRVVVISGLWSIDRTRGFLIELTLKDDKTRGEGYQNERMSLVGLSPTLIAWKKTEGLGSEGGWVVLTIEWAGSYRRGVGVMKGKPGATMWGWVQVFEHTRGRELGNEEQTSGVRVYMGSCRAPGRDTELVCDSKSREGSWVIRTMLIQTTVVTIISPFSDCPGCPARHGHIHLKRAPKRPTRRESRGVAPSPGTIPPLLWTPRPTPSRVLMHHKRLARIPSCASLCIFEYVRFCFFFLVFLPFPFPSFPNPACSLRV